MENHSVGENLVGVDVQENTPTAESIGLANLARQVQEVVAPNLQNTNDDRIDREPQEGVNSSDEVDASQNISVNFNQPIESSSTSLNRNEEEASSTLGNSSLSNILSSTLADALRRMAQENMISTRNDEASSSSPLSVVNSGLSADLISSTLGDALRQAYSNDSGGSSTNNSQNSNPASFSGYRISSPDDSSNESNSDEDMTEGCSWFGSGLSTGSGISNNNPPNLIPIEFSADELSSDEDRMDFSDTLAIRNIPLPPSQAGPSNSNIASSESLLEKRLKFKSEPSDSRFTNLPEYAKKCAFCSGPADLVCSNCFRVAYCCEEHQLLHFQQHNKDCEHLALLRRSDVLRYRGPIAFEKNKMAASTEKQNDTILTVHTSVVRGTKLMEEKPFLIVPWCRTQLRENEVKSLNNLSMRSMSCFGCCKYLGFNYHICSICTLPLCSVDCLQKENHLKNECLFVKEMLQAETDQKKKNQFLFVNLFDKNGDVRMKFLYTDVMILRLIVKLSAIQIEKGQAEYEQIWNKMCTTWKIDFEHRLAKSKTAISLVNSIDQFLPISCFVTKGKLDMISNLYCIIESNSFRFDLPFRRFNVLCTVLNHAQHSCIPNSHAYLQEQQCSMDPTNDDFESELEDLTIVLKSGHDLKTGNQITFSYVPSIFGTLERRLFLLDAYLFWCKCRRCEDPNECGSMISNVFCQVCHTGRLSPPSVLLKNATALLPLADSDSAPSKYIWTCSSNRPKKCEIIAGSSTQTRRILDLLKKIEIGTMTRFGRLEEVAEFIHFNAVSRSAAGRAGVAPTLCPIPLSTSHYIFMKLYDDLLRGAFFPLADFTTTSLEQFDISMLKVVYDAHKTYKNTMKVLNPGFNFEGFPTLTLEMMMNEYELRKFDAAMASIHPAISESRIERMAGLFGLGLDENMLTRRNSTVRIAEPPTSSNIVTVHPTRGVAARRGAYTGRPVGYLRQRLGLDPNAPLP